MLVARRALGLVLADLDRVAAACARLARAHRDDDRWPARTLLQQAVPTTFGLKAAGWLVAVVEARRGLRRVLARAAGGPARRRGRNARGARREAARRCCACFAARARAAEPPPALAHEPRCASPSSAPRSRPPPERWRRSGSTSSCSRRPRSARSPRPAGGGSSTMPQKRNPVGSTLARRLRAARARGRRRAPQRRSCRSTSAPSGAGTRSGTRSHGRSRSRAGRPRPSRSCSEGLRSTPSGCGRTSTRRRSPSAPSRVRARRRRARGPAAPRGAGGHASPRIGSRPRSTRRLPRLGRAVRRPRARPLRGGRRVSVRHRFDGAERAPTLVLANSLGDDAGALGRATSPRSRRASASSATTTAATAARRCRPGPIDRRGPGRRTCSSSSTSSASSASRSAGSRSAAWSAWRSPRVRPSGSSASSSAARRRTFAPPEAWLERARRRARRRDRARSPTPSLERWFTPGFRRPTEVRRALPRDARRDPAGGLRALLRGARAPGTPASGSPRSPRPTLVVAGADDPSTPPDARSSCSPAASRARELIGPRERRPSRQRRAARGVRRRGAEPRSRTGGTDDDDAHERGMKTRREVLGDEHVDRAVARTTDVHRRLPGSDHALRLGRDLVAARASTGARAAASR